MSNDIQWTNNHLAFRSRKLIWLSALLIVSIIGSGYVDAYNLAKLALKML